MGEISTSPISTAGPAIPAGTSGLPLPGEQRAALKAISKAVRTLNEVQYAGEGREVAFSVDPASRKPVVRVVDTNTKEIIVQWPSSYVLQLAAQAADTTSSK